jgi:hypothetical protein
VDAIKRIVSKVASRKLAVTAVAVTAVAGAAAVTGTIELTWPMATVACCYVLSQAAVDTWGN